MQCRATLVAICLAGFVLAGCGAHLAAEGTTPASDVSRPGQEAISDLATTGQTSAAQPAAGPIKIPPDFPPNYRIHVAAALAGDYFEEGRGAPEISDFQRSTAPRGIHELCVQYPAAITGGTRRMLIWSTPKPFDASRTEIRKRNLDFFQSCRGTMYRFVELERLVEKLKACNARGDKRCGVYNDGRGTRTVILP